MTARSLLALAALAACGGADGDPEVTPPSPREAITDPPGNTPPVPGANDGHATTTTAGAPGGARSPQTAATGAATCMVDQRRYTAAFAVERAGECVFSKTQHGKPALSVELLAPEGSPNPSRLQALAIDFKGPGNYQTSPDGSQVNLTVDVEPAEGDTKVLTGQSAGGPQCIIAVGESEITTVASGQQELVPVTITCPRLHESSHDKVACNMTPNSWNLVVPCTSAEGPL